MRHTTTTVELPKVTINPHGGVAAAFVDELQQFTARTVAAALHDDAGTENEEEDYA